MTRRGDQRAGDRSLLVIDGSYTFDAIERLGLEQSVYARDLDGFFSHVWSVHPFGDVSVTQGGSGAPEVMKMNPRHSFIQAKPGRFRLLERAFPLNFALAQIGLLFRLVRLVKRQRIDLVRAGDPLYVGLLGWTVARLTGRPFMVRINANNDRIRQSIGGPIYPRLLRSAALEKRIERFVLPRADLVVAPNQDNVDFAVANGAKPDKVEIFRYGNLLSSAHLKPPAERGVDTAVFERLGVEPARYLLCVSRLQDVKFPEDAVRVLAEVRKAGHDVKLVLAGEGPMRAAVESLAAELGVTNQVVLPGNLDQTSLAQVYAHSAALISPLTGRALSEAALGGAPIVAYDLDWQRDLIESGVTGELIPFRDIEAMGRAVMKFLDGRAYAAEMGAAVRERALDILDPVKLNAHERATYARLLGLSAAVEAPCEFVSA